MGWCWLSAVGLLFAQTRIASEGHWLRLIFSMVAARHSRIVLARAAAALQAMEAAEELEAFERHWQEFLHRVERVWIKCTAQYKSSSRWQGWSGEMVRLRRNDPLLSHLKNARDADQHTLSAITARRPSELTLTAGGPQGRALIKRLTIDRDGQLAMEGHSVLKVVFRPEQTRLMPVVNRGRTYPVPRSHLSRPINPEDVLAVAHAGWAFYAIVLDQVEACSALMGTPDLGLTG